MAAPIGAETPAIAASASPTNGEGDNCLDQRKAALVAPVPGRRGGHRPVTDRHDFAAVAALPHDEAAAGRTALTERMAMREPAAVARVRGGWIGGVRR